MEKQLQQTDKKQGGFARTAGIVGNVLFAGFMVVMAVLVFFLVQSRMTGGTPSVAGYQMYIVLSDSMVPIFRAGSMVVVKPVNPGQLQEGDIITFKPSAVDDTTVTHRIVDVRNEDGLEFTTRGDANNADDAHPVPAKNVVGRVALSIPYAGFIVNWSRTKAGVIGLVVVPGIIIIALELRNMFKYAAELDKEKEAKQKAAAQAAGDDGAATEQV